MSDRRSDGRGFYGTVSACGGIRATCEPHVSTQEIYPDVCPRSGAILSTDAPVTSPKSPEAAQ